MAEVVKDWTIMVYMAGDNNLSEDMITAMKGMIELGKVPNINLVVLYDGCYPFAPIKFYNFSKSSLLTTIAGKNSGNISDFEDDLFADEEVNKTSDAAAAGTNETVHRPSRPPKDLSELETLKIADFVPQILKRFPATRTAFILSGHSDGIIGKRLLPDDDSSAKLNLISLRRVLEAKLEKIKTTDGKPFKFDLLGFDGCLMGMLEVGFEMKSVAKIMVASQGNIPTAGWIYDRMFADFIATNGSLETAKLAVSMVDNYANYNEDFTVGGRSINISACDLEVLETDESPYKYVQELGKLFYDILNLPVEKPVKDETKTEETDSASTEMPEEYYLQNRVIREKFIDWMTLSHYQSQTFMHSQAVDLIDFTYNLLLNFRKWTAENEIMKLIVVSPGGGNKDRTTTVMKIENRIAAIFEKFIEINTAINNKNQSYLLKSCSIGAEYQFSQGVSVFLPWSRMAFRMIRFLYSQLNFNDNENWLKFIDKLTLLTLREYREDPLFNDKFSSLENVTYSQLTDREVGGREVGGREVGGREVGGREVGGREVGGREVGGREVGGREVGGREVGGRGISFEFYFYFSQIRNYKPEVFKQRLFYADQNTFTTDK
ncbi:MAG TPA: clostripain-related cysteine peptidase [Pyrinomonadaceae bacterium]|nr:clostripain-related cysteine peptidase [Pyrinomonadaceae bacterium]